MDTWLKTRTSLIARLKNPDDNPAWAKFYDTYGPVIHGMAMRTGLSREDAEDIVQETARGVLQRIEGFAYDPARGSFKNWLFTMTRSRIIDRWRKRGREARFVVHPEPSTGSDTTDFIARVPAPDADLAAHWEREWQQTLFEAALRRLRSRIDPVHYQIFDLYVRREWSPQKVAELMAVDVGQVYLVKSRVKELLRQELEHLETGTTAR